MYFLFFELGEPSWYLKAGATRSAIPRVIKDFLDVLRLLADVKILPMPPTNWIGLILSIAKKLLYSGHDPNKIIVINGKKTTNDYGQDR